MALIQIYWPCCLHLFFTCFKASVIVIAHFTSCREPLLSSLKHRHRDRRQKIGFIFNKRPFDSKCHQSASVSDHLAQSSVDWHVMWSKLGFKPASLFGPSLHSESLSPDLHCPLWTFCSSAKSTGKVWQKATMFWILKLRKRTGKPNFCSLRTNFLAARRDSSTLIKRKRKQRRWLETHRHTIVWGDVNPDKPLGSQADDFPTLEDGRCCFWLPDPSDDPCESLKNSENENQCRAYYVST